MADRYFVETPITGTKTVLQGGEAHHLAHVMRAKPGELLVLFDGSGAEFSARIVQIGRNRVELEVLGREEIDRELPVELTLAVSLPKGDRQKWLVEKAVELGVGRIVPLVTARSVAQPTRQAAERLRRTVIAASKQCGRNRLMAIGESQSWAEFLSASADASSKWLAHPQDHVRASGGLPKFEPSSAVILAVGPEGGFSDEELASARASGWQSIDLGPRILRVETAAIALAARVAAACDNA